MSTTKKRPIYKFLIFHFRISGLVVGFFYHVFTHDKEGSMGIALRSAVQSTGIQGTMDDKLFATLFVTIFMQLSGILMLPEFFGPSFNLLLLPKRILANFTTGTSKTVNSATVKKVVEENTSDDGEESEDNATTPAGKRKRKKNKKKTN